jgi:hypothetical protein
MQERSRNRLSTSWLKLLSKCIIKEFASCIEHYNDQVIFDFFPIVDIFPDSLGAKSRSVETKR